MASSKLEPPAGERCVLLFSQHINIRKCGVTLQSAVHEARRKSSTCDVNNTLWAGGVEHCVGTLVGFCSQTWHRRLFPCQRSKQTLHNASAPKTMIGVIAQLTRPVCRVM